MLRPDQRLALYMEGKLGAREGKMGYGLLRFSPNPIACVIDSAHAGKDVRDAVDTPRSCPVVASVEAAADLGAEVLVLGIAPSGGRVPPEWIDVINRAVELGMSIVNGLHDRLADGRTDLGEGQWIWDIRREPADAGVASGRAGKLDNERVVVVGTDMAQGKMTAALAMHRAALARGVRSAFLATGQIGIAICGSGVALDAVRLDYAAGAVENMVLAAAAADVVFVEGQGSLVHPGSSATLPLLRGTCPTHLVLCHRAGQAHLVQYPWIRIPDLRRLARLYEDLAETCGAYRRPETIGIALNTGGLDPAAAREAVDDLQRRTSLPVTDVLRFGPEPLLARLLGREG